MKYEVSDPTCDPTLYCGLFFPAMCHLSLLSIEWNSIRLGGPAHGIVTKTVHKTLLGGGGGLGGGWVGGCRGGGGLGNGWVGVVGVQGWMGRGWWGSRGGWVGGGGGPGGGWGRGW